MAALPLAVRRRRAIDPRVLIGVVLVLASALGTTALVAALTRTTTVYRADRPLLTGERVTAARLGTATVRLGEAQGLYLSGPLPADGMVVTRGVAAGEMVPRSAVGTVAGVRTATVVIDLAAPLAQGVGPGGTVDLWSAPRLTGVQERYGPPVVLVGDAVVSRGPDRGGLVPGAREDTGEVQGPRDDVADVLEAQSGGARVTALAVGDAR